MTNKDQIISFKKMWTWLSGYPAHDREYYMQFVVELDQPWQNSCPLANNDTDNCTGCQDLWGFGNGSLCTDPESPLYKWNAASRHYPDNRSFFASQVAVLAMQLIHDMKFDIPGPSVIGKDVIFSQADR